jgi:hypothetical protein
MEDMGAVMSPVSDQLDEGVIQLARLTMLYGTSAITISIISRSHASLSMVAIGESIFARSVNRNQCLFPPVGRERPHRAT